MIYFDNSATTFVDEDVLAEFIHVLKNSNGNPSSSHIHGQSALMLLEQARHRAAQALGVKTEEIIFTSGGTESNNLAVKGTAYANKHRGRHIITTSVEHASVFEACRQLEEEGYTVTYLSVDGAGRISLDELKNALREDTILVSIMGVNSELGSVQPVNEISELLCNYPNTVYHVDFVQGFGKIGIGLERIDLLSISGHKLHAPKGTGLLYVKNGIRLTPIQAGGGQENGMRSGTENPAGFVALSLAMEKQVMNFNEHAERYDLLKTSLIEGLRMIPGVTINSPEDGAPHIVHFSMGQMNSLEIMEILGEAEIYVSKGSACSSKSLVPSRVLTAAGITGERAEGAVRVSFSHKNTLEEVDCFIMCLIRLSNQEIMPL